MAEKADHVCDSWCDDPITGHPRAAPTERELWGRCIALLGLIALPEGGRVEPGGFIYRRAADGWSTQIVVNETIRDRILALADKAGV